MAEKKRYGTVLIKADVILEYLYEAENPQGLTSIADHTGLTKSTALKILDTLEYIGYVNKNKKDRSYSIGFKLMKYSSISSSFIRNICLYFVKIILKISSRLLEISTKSSSLSFIY